MSFPMSILASPQHPGSWICRYIVPGASHDAVTSIAGPGSHIPSPGSQLVFSTFCIQMDDLLSLELGPERLILYLGAPLRRLTPGEAICAALVVQGTRAVGGALGHGIPADRAEPVD